MISVTKAEVTEEKRWNAKPVEGCLAEPERTVSVVVDPCAVALRALEREPLLEDSGCDWRPRPRVAPWVRAPVRLQDDWHVEAGLARVAAPRLPVDEPVSPRAAVGHLARNDDRCRTGAESAVRRLVLTPGDRCGLARSDVGPIIRSLAGGAGTGFCERVAPLSRGGFPPLPGWSRLPERIGAFGGDERSRPGCGWLWRDGSRGDLGPAPPSRNARQTCSESRKADGDPKAGDVPGAGGDRSTANAVDGAQIRSRGRNRIHVRKGQ